MRTVTTLANYKENLDTLIEMDKREYSKRHSKYLLNETMRKFAVGLIDKAKEVETKVKQQIFINDDVMMEITLDKTSIFIKLYENEKEVEMLNDELITSDAIITTYIVHINDTSYRFHSFVVKEDNDQLFAIYEIISNALESEEKEEQSSTIED